MNPKKQLIEKAVRNGALSRANQLLAAAQILSCEANNLMEEAADILKMNGLCLGLLKKRHYDFVKSADRYFSEFSRLVTTDESVMEMFEHVDEFNQYFREWAKIPEGWKPDAEK